MKNSRSPESPGVTVIGATRNRLRSFWTSLPADRPAPLPKGQRQAVGEMLTTLLEYDNAGRFRKELSQKMVHAQLHLARQGYSTGGRPPFGFRRFLVHVDGTIGRELAKGEVIRSAGHHVVWLPGPSSELELIQRILELLSKMPATQVARQLNSEGIPSPDAGRMRKDNGVRHEVSGRWNATTIINIARNPLLVALVQWGRRSMGDQSRFSPHGPRDLQDSDFRADGKPKVIRNPEADCVRVTGRFEPVVNPIEHGELISELDRRAGSQRGKPRSRSPEKNPLGRVFDIACGWPMYRVPMPNRTSTSADTISSQAARNVPIIT